MQTRKMIMLAFVGAGALALGACAGQPGQKTAKNGKKQHLVCVARAPLGSHIAHEQCMTKAAYEAQKKRDAKSKDALERAQERANTKISGGGGS